jgi:hypothetical protein
MIFLKISLKLDLFIKFCNVIDWHVFVNSSMWKSLIILHLENPQSLFYKMVSRMELLQNICIFGGFVDCDLVFF